jgi:hypothetical protein
MLPVSAAAAAATAHCHIYVIMSARDTSASLVAAAAAYCLCLLLLTNPGDYICFLFFRHSRNDVSQGHLSQPGGWWLIDLSLKLDLVEEGLTGQAAAAAAGHPPQLQLCAGQQDRHEHALLTCNVLHQLSTHPVLSPTAVMIVLQPTA